MVCLRAHDQLKQIRSVTDPSRSITYSGGSGIETDDSWASSIIGCDEAEPTKPVWLTSIVKKPITAGRKSIKVTTMVPNACANMKPEGLCVIALPLHPLPAMESEAKAGSPRQASARACRRRRRRGGGMPSASDTPSRPASSGHGGVRPSPRGTRRDRAVTRSGAAGA